MDDANADADVDELFVGLFDAFGEIFNFGILLRKTENGCVCVWIVFIFYSCCGSFRGCLFFLFIIFKR